jgi:hypothetical protein
MERHAPAAAVRDTQGKGPAKRKEALLPEAWDSVAQQKGVIAWTSDL